MTSSREQAWSPPALRREPAAPAGPGVDAWLLADLAIPVAALPGDASYEAGYADGLRDGVGQAGAQVQSALAALAGIARDLDGRQAELLRNRERDMQALALAVARGLVQREVDADPALLAGWLARALELLPSDLQVTIRIHPDSFDAMGTLRDTVVPAGAGVALHWLADPAVGRAGFVVESPQRLVDGRLDVALRTLYERFERE